MLSIMELLQSIQLRTVSFLSGLSPAVLSLLIVYLSSFSFSQHQLINFNFSRHLSSSTWKTMVELRKVFDAFIAFISQTTVRFIFHAEKKEQFMLLKEYMLSNSKFHQVLVHGDLTLSNS